MSTKSASMYLLNFMLIVCVSLLSLCRPSGAADENEELPVFYYTKPAISTGNSGVISRSYIGKSDGKIVYTLSNGNDISGLAVNSKGEIYFGILSDDPYTVTLNKIDENGDIVSLGTVYDAGGNGSYRYVDSGFNIAVNSKDELYYTTPVRSDGNGNISEPAKIKSYKDKTVVYTSSLNFTGLAFDLKDDLYFSQEDKVFKYRTTPFSYIFRSHGDIRGLTFLTETRIVYGVLQYGPLTVKAYEKELFDELQPEQYAGVTITTDTSAPEFDDWEYINAHWIFSVAYKPQIHVLVIGIQDRTSSWNGIKSAERVATAFESMENINKENVRLELFDFEQGHKPTGLDTKLAIKGILRDYNSEECANDSSGNNCELSEGDTFILYIETHGGFKHDCKWAGEIHGSDANIQCDEKTTQSVKPGSSDITNQIVNISDEYIALQDNDEIPDEESRWTDDNFAEFFNDNYWNNINKLILLSSCYSGGFWGSYNKTMIEATPGEEKYVIDHGDLSTLKKIALVSSSSERRMSASIGGLWNDGSFYDNGMSLFAIALEEVLKKNIHNKNLTLTGLYKEISSKKIHDDLKEEVRTFYGKAVGYSMASSDLIDSSGVLIPFDFKPFAAKSDDFQLTPYAKEGVLTTGSSSILSLMKPVLTEPAKKVSHWAGYNVVCCSRGPVTFSLTNNDVTKHEVAATCTSGSSWEGWVPAEAGQNNFTWRLAGPCSIYTGSFPYQLEEGLYYRFLARWIGNGVLITTDVYDYEPIFTSLGGHTNKASKQSKVTYIPYTEKARECLQPSNSVQ